MIFLSNLNNKKHNKLKNQRHVKTLLNKNKI